MPILHSKMFYLFAHQVSPLEIERMSFSSIRYWTEHAVELDKIRNKPVK